MTSELTDAIERITRITARVERDEGAIGVYSTGEQIAVALVLNRLDLLPHGGYTAVAARHHLDESPAGGAAVTRVSWQVAAGGLDSRRPARNSRAMSRCTKPAERGGGL